MQDVALIEMKNITKTFPGVLANENVSFEVFPGQIHALLGENGAGKSTLMSILAGLYRPDSGQLKVKGEIVQFTSPKDALEAKIGMIYQHFRLIDTFTVAENIVLGAKKETFRLNYQQMNDEVREFSARMGLTVNPEAKVGALSLGEQQRVEILKMLYRGCEVLIMDEPTTVLTPQEVEDLFATLRHLTKQGMAVILITHKMNEVMAVADEVTVLRRGRVVGTERIEFLNREKLTAMMLRERALEVAVPAENIAGETVLEVRNLSVKTPEGYWALQGINLEVRAGEIMAIAGVAGNGQSELIESIGGLCTAESGNILLHGEDITELSVRGRIEKGVALVPEQRLGVGLVPGLDIYDNSIVRSYFSPEFSGKVLLKRNNIEAHAEKLVDDYRVSVFSLKNPVNYMSGGNLQKLLLGREIENKPQVLLAAYPVRGLDVGSAQYVYQIFRNERAKGMAILLVLEDLDDVFNIADRVAVMYTGRIQAVLEVNKTDIKEIGALMLGAEIRSANV